MGKENFIFQMVENIMEIGKIIKWMVMVYLHGQMVDVMMDM